MINKKSFNSISLFDFYDKIKLLLALIANRLLNSNYLVQKKQQMDSFLAEGYKISKKKDKLIVIIPEGKQVTLRTNSSDWEVFIQIFKNREYLPLVNLINFFNYKPLFIIDAGSNIGLTTIFLSNHFKEAFFYCIEPDHNNFEVLKNNVEINGIESRIDNFALWNCNECVSISNKFRDGQAWSLQTIKSNENYNVVKSITLKEITRNYKLNRIDVLKIDIEGTEEVIFSDIEIFNVLSICAFIIVEIHEEICDREKILNNLRSANFEMFFYGEHTIGYNKNILNGHKES
jgi:FkbM family methyltransferase